MDDIEVRLVEHRLCIREMFDVLLDLMWESAGPGDTQLPVDGTRSTPGLVWAVLLDEVETSRVNDGYLLIQLMIKDTVRNHRHKDLLRVRAGPSDPSPSTEQDQQDQDYPDEQGMKARERPLNLILGQNFVLIALGLHLPPVHGQMPTSNNTTAVPPLKPTTCPRVPSPITPLMALGVL
eukprot:CAMPEP_0177244278 /NCGR_PEP_ID=MMETSP0367-20130122/49820_1 /TAXON_ID=447022 ORGANISM="Scrippsiella hangoei-like, Strain SHHI-4" /NCGR_SAMPLE_ID=MMETSP0367 /ASSEMBLY_ACC=CAM_ASM_000362 /LENGTH=178 /DNA_ID=CAMNT_0018696079 /DNA_START=91 /DNA_END=628 /DNA_ORIENTATION=+